MRRRWISVLYYTIQKSQFSCIPYYTIQKSQFSSEYEVQQGPFIVLSVVWYNSFELQQHCICSYTDKRAIVSNMAVLGFYHKIVIRHHHLYPSVLVEQSKLEFIWTHCTVSSADHGQTHVLQISSWRTADICHYYPRANLVLFPSHLKCITTM